MGRMTRAKTAQVANDLHVDGDALSELPDDALHANNEIAPDAERPPLGEILRNNQSALSADNNDVAEPSVPNKKQRKGRKKAKNATKPAPDSTEETEHVETLASDAPSATSADTAPIDAQVDGHSHGEGAELPGVTSTIICAETARPNDDGENVPNDSSDVRSQTTPIDAEANSPVQANAETSATNMATLAIHAPASPLPNAMPNVIHSLRKSNMRSCSNKENFEPPASPSLSESRTPLSRSTYDVLEAAVIDAATPTAARSRRTSSIAPVADTTTTVADTTHMTPEVPDELSDSQLPDRSAPSPTASLSETDTQASIPIECDKPKSKKPAPVVRSTKTSQARISMAQGGKVAPRPSLGPPSNALGGPNTARKTSQRTVSGNSEPQEATIPHSKPRPMSMSFPAPPPPLKSSKAPTRPTFQLPGEAVSAKLRAAREERLRKEAEEANARRNFKARLAPDMGKQTAQVRPTNASRVRESSIGVKQANAALIELSRSRAASSATVKSRSASGTSQSSRPPTSLATTSSRPTTAMDVQNTRPASKDSSMSKGAEVLSRPARAREAAEAEKRAKEEIIKKARAEAAERSRQLSREWAEKQRVKKLQQTAQSVSVN